MSKKGIFYIHKYVFEYDALKSATNKLKHGINFEEAQQLWNDDNLVIIKAKHTEELRYLVIGKLESKHWSAVITYRRSKIRIISVRRSRASEVKLYES